MTCETLPADIAAALLAMLDTGMYTGAALFFLGFLFASTPSLIYSGSLFSDRHPVHVVNGLECYSVPWYFPWDAFVRLRQRQGFSVIGSRDFFYLEKIEKGA